MDVSSHSRILTFESQCHTAPSLRLIIPSGLSMYCPFFRSMGTELMKVSGAPTAVCSSLFHLGGGWSLHRVLSLAFRGQMEDPTIRFASFSYVVCMRGLLSVLLLIRHCCYLNTSSSYAVAHSGHVHV
jgi:hypothetical protein